MDADQAWIDWERRGVGQFRQAYAIMPLGTAVLEGELPEVNRNLERLGAYRWNFLDQLEPSLPDRVEVMQREPVISLTARRPTMEAAFARAAEETPRLTVRRGVALRSYAVGAPDGDGIPHVCGVVLESGELLDADLVIDATGRNSRIKERLVEIGARSPVDSQLDNSTIYYTRYYRSPSGELPEYSGGAGFIGGQSIGLFWIPADNATWCLSVWGMADDAALRPLRQEQIFNAVAGRFPDRQVWLEGEPISDIVPLVSAGDMTRSFVIDETPVATGVVAVGDAHAFTEPRLGRGTTFGVMDAVTLRDTVRAHLGQGPTGFALAYHEAYGRELGPWLRAANSAGRNFTKETRAYITGDGPEFDAANRGMVLNRALVNASRVDSEVGRWLLDLAGGLAHPADLFGRAGVVDRILELGDHETEAAAAGPTRNELLGLLAGV
jgi:2-polyprenyl-6-methoxyphenol hydroxylase-like FAD-dependent oxidoreductase